jgi:hypothetical protein
VDTQKTCFPELSVDPEDVYTARELVIKLKDPQFYSECSIKAKENYKKYYSIEVYKNKLNQILS